MMKRLANGSWRNLSKICTRSWKSGVATSTSSAKGLHILKSSQAPCFGSMSNTFKTRPMHKSTVFMAFGSAFCIASMGLSDQASSEAVPEDSHDSHATMVPISHPDEHIDPEKIMKQVEAGIQERLKSLKLSPHSLSPYTVSAKGQQVSVKIPISPLCDLWSLLVDVVARIGKLNGGTEGEKMLVSASESVVAQVLTLESKDHYKLYTGEAPSPNSLSIGVFEPLIGEKFPEIEFLKKGYYSEDELDIVVSTLKLASSEKVRNTPRQQYKKQYERKSKSSSSKSLLDALESMGVKVYANGNQEGQPDTDVISWDNIAGYHEQKREIEDTVLLALRCPEVYDSIARGTRRKFESNRPRAVLFEGPPGTGKTSSARVIANQAGVPLLYVPLEAIMSKYYGESERALGKVFNTANELENGAIIFLDEIDSLAMTRDSEMHEATRRTLSVLLRQIDGFEQDKRVVVIAATNRKEDLDPALISRFDSSITFGLPDQKTREEIISQYACHLKPDELAAVAAASERMSGRDLRDICQQAERRWASKVIRNQKGAPLSHGLPPLEEYICCAEKRRNAMEVYHKEHRGRSQQRIHPSPGPPSVVV